MNNTISPKVSFGSIIQVSKLAYAREVVDKLDMPNIQAPWTIYQSKYLKYGLSEEASHCTMGVIKNEFGNGFMFHLRPGASSLKKIFEHLHKAVMNLKYGKDLTGILVGGNSGYKPSKEQYQSLQSMFKELNIKYSALLGQNDVISPFPVLPYCNLYFNGNQDKYIICPVANSIKSLHIPNMNELNKYFDTIIINKNDKLKLN